MKPVLKRLLLGATVLGILALFYVKTSRVAFNQHERFRLSLREFQQQDTELNEDILKAQLRLLPDYDGLSSGIQDLQRIVGHLGQVPSFIAEPSQSELRQQVGELTELVAQKGELLETFKSQNATLHNSLRYFPFAGAEWLRRAATNEPSRELLAPLNELMRQVLVYHENPRPEEAAAIRSSLEQMNDWRRRHAQLPQALTLASLTAHIESIVTRKPIMDAVTRNLVSLPTHARSETLLRAYEEQFAASLRVSRFYQTALLALCALLVIGIGYTLFALDSANARLERRVQERTADLARNNLELQEQIAERQQAEFERKEIHQQLLEISRQAGMAEVATGVLHNVGNVLNSVNVSATLIGDTVKKSKIANLAKVTTLLQEHQSDLGEYITRDAKGRQLPGYIGQLAQHLSREQEGTLLEIESLRKNIEHIKEIVSMQQSYARVSGIVETVQLSELVEDALRLNSGALERHGVEVIRQYENTGAVLVEKHKVLQILVNLVRNAKYACADTERSDKQLTLRVSQDESRARIEIIDNGVGIPEENLLRVFNHGFTTRKDGHGFGLHSGALAAQELGGSLSVRSGGLGQGARFTLELPCRSEERQP